MIVPSSIALREIQSEAHKLTTVQVLGAIEAGDWLALHRLAERLDELAQRGLYHESQKRAKEMASYLNGYREPEPR